MQRVLVVDDEPQIRKQLKIGLGGYGYDVTTAINGEDALMLIAQQHPDLVLLDISLGSLPDGIDVCRQLREWSKIPVIMLSVHEDEKTKVKALNVGADDYLTKPFGMEELHARIQAISRRIHSDNIPTKTEIRVGELVINLVNRTVFVGDEQIHLTPKEYDLLRLLATHQGKVLTHRTILNSVWGAEYADMDHYVRVFINQLRKKLKENPARNLRYILNEPGIGYRFVEPKS